MVNNFINDLVLATAIILIFQDGRTTTLDVKLNIRERHPELYITQDMVSSSMDGLYNLGLFNYITDETNTYRIYTLNVDNISEDEDVIVEKEVTISKSDAFDIINSLKVDDELHITFFKKNKELRDMNAKIYSPNKGDGFIRAYDMDLETDNIRTIDIRRLISFVINDVRYTIVK